MKPDLIVILEKVVRLVNESPELSIAQLLDSKHDELGLDEKDVCELKESFGLIDAFSAKQNELNQSRKQGDSRPQFIAGQIERIASSLSDAEAAVLLDAVDASAEKIVAENCKSVD
jgi:hypothetical protein